MPASASVALTGQAGSVRPPQVQPHANGPSRSVAQGNPNAQHRSHKHSTSADMMDHRLQRPSQRKNDKDLPTVPGTDGPRISRPTQMTEAERYKAQSQQKYSDKDSQASYGHSSLSSSHGHYHHGHSSSHGHTTTTASQSSHTSGSSMGRHRSATVAGYHGGSGLDASTSSSSSAQGHSSSSRLRRKQPPTEALWEPGMEPIVLSPSDETMPMTGTGRSRNRSTGVYRDPPTSATVPMNGQATWSRATGASAASSTKTIGQPQYVLQDAHPPLPSTTSLGRHHHSASASVPVGSQRTTVQTYWDPNGAAAAAASSSQTQDKLVYRASTSTGQGSGSANSSTPTPKANQFATTPTQGQAHANAQNAKAYKLNISAAEQAANATAPAGISYFTVPMNSSSDEQPRSTRGRKQSQGRAASASASRHAMSPSTASASTEGSSHGDGEGEGDSDLWKSGTSLSQMSQSHASMGQKRGRQNSTSQQRLPVPAQPAQRRSRGSSDAPAPQAHYLVKLPSRKDEKDGHRPGTAMSGNGDEDRGRGRIKEKETFFGRVRARSNSLTKGFSKAIQYPIYLAKGGSKRSSKQVTANANGSDGALAYSDLGHGGRTSGEDGFEYAYTPSTSTATTSTAASPISSKHPGTGGNGNPSKSSVNILPAQHQYTPPKPHKREHKRSLSAQPALGNMQALSPPPLQRSTGVAGVPSAFQRLKKPLTAKEREQRDLNRASPMTRAKIHVLQDWEGVDLNPRLSGVAHAQVQVSQSRTGDAVAFPRIEQEGRERGEVRNYGPAIPYMDQQPHPRRRNRLET